MSTVYNSLQELVKRKSSGVVPTHCMILRKGLLSNLLSPGINTVWIIVINVAKYMETKPLKSRENIESNFLFEETNFT